MLKLLGSQTCPPAPPGQAGHATSDMQAFLPAIDRIWNAPRMDVVKVSEKTV